MTAVELIDVSKHYGEVRAVDGISLTVDPGEFATILGPSGSGKTTMLALLAGIVEPSAGTIRIGGRDVTRAPARSFDEVIVTLFVSGTYMTVPKRMFNELVMQINPTITAIATLLIGLSIVSVAVVGLLMRRGGLLARQMA